MKTMIKDLLTLYHERFEKEILDRTSTRKIYTFLQYGGVVFDNVSWFS